MQRIAAHLGIPLAALALAMLVGVQFGHSPLHHVAEHVAAHATTSTPSGECHHGSHGHHHHGGSGHHHHSHADDQRSSHPLGHHDHDTECQLCDLALSPATLTSATTIELSESLVLETTLLAQPVLESAELWVAPARGPPAQQA